MNASKTGGQPAAASAETRRGQGAGQAAEAPHRWSAEVTAKSDALDLEKGVFSHRAPRRIALSLKKSAEASRRRKASPFQSAMSMLNFFINRAGRKLPASRRQVLEQAKDELRVLFKRTRASDK